MIDRHVFGRREAVVCLNSIDIIDTIDAGAGKRVFDSAADMREDIIAAAAFGNFLLVTNRRRTMPPSSYLRKFIE
jgi:hypothetical protein